MSTAPIYIIGTERSGSNLMRVILNAHPNIDVPHPPHLMKYFGGLAAGYGDLNQEGPRRALVTDVLRLIRTHISPWEIAIDADEVVRNSTDLMSVVGAIYDQHLRFTGKHRWGCKSTFMVHHVEAALNRDPGARFIWLVRDPRDVAASSKKSVFSPCHPVLTARLWRAQQEEALQVAQTHPESVLRLRYEDLLGQPEASIRMVCDFLGEDFDPALLNHEQTSAAQQGAQLSASWKNTAAPILTGNTGKYKTGLTEREIAMVEATSTPIMEELGYVRDTQVDVPSVPEWLVQLDNARQRLNIEWRSMREDKNHWRRWNRAVLMTWLSFRRAS